MCERNKRKMAAIVYACNGHASIYERIILAWNRKFSLRLHSFEKSDNEVEELLGLGGNGLDLRGLGRE